ncbi:uncharacterized protein LOC125866906 [Solanum stenotomum]|uniref:uncharacterized protein LOC125866906 n=1 Tax=Solanum stenotomum TaxID=172797 RepID=UPI0020D13FB5|nr:uncharacterized protein LOC125866906 [Solanum stenotomum]
MDGILMRCLTENPKRKAAGRFHINLLAPYALAIWYGARFILGKGYTGGQVLNVFDVKLLHSVASDLLLKGEFSAKMCDAGGELTMHRRNVSSKFYFYELQC